MADGLITLSSRSDFAAPLTRRKFLLSEKLAARSHPLKAITPNDSEPKRPLKPKPIAPNVPAGRPTVVNDVMEEVRFSTLEMDVMVLGDMRPFDFANLDPKYTMANPTMITCPTKGISDSPAAGKPSVKSPEPKAYKECVARPPTMTSCIHLGP